MTKRPYLTLTILILVLVLIAVAMQFTPGWFQEAGINPPATEYSRAQGDTTKIEVPCSNEHPEWRKSQVIDGVDIVEAPFCEPDNPYDIAASVKGTNNISMATLMQSNLAEDALVMGDDVDHDGDPDVIHIKLEVVEFNGASPDGNYLINTYDIAPGIQPGLWAFAPKSSGMALKNFSSREARPFLRAPSPTIRVEQGDKVYITLENTHYLPHTIHLHGVDHAFVNSKGEDNDGMEMHPVFPGKSHTYEIQPRHTGTMLYHCHVQTAQHMMMGLSGIFVIEENQPNNWVQTFNVGAGQVRHPSVAVKKTYNQEYDLLYQSIDKRLASTIQSATDPRLVAKHMGRDYNITESFENYFLLNGHSFPYTLRDSMIVVGDNEAIKIRIANVQQSEVAIHFHGHKATITAMDGVDLASGQQVTRDVFDIAVAQRIDLNLKTSNDGLHSYGPGLWMFHDHVLTGTTTDGLEPGGNMAILAYKPLIDEQGMPKMHDQMLAEVFDKDYYAKKQAPWQQSDYASSFGDAGLISPDVKKLVIFGLLIGLIAGLLIVLIMVRRKRQE
ncbi:multicopper oxidase domain-containing protein [Methyloglobulus sp.]|uniref:multicopper oxidase domain-containing protein n=1 Tax=Methyloglobulus sp. TaxID=2518622 RepID=UPI0032B77C6C